MLHVSEWTCMSPSLGTFGSFFMLKRVMLLLCLLPDFSVSTTAPWLETAYTEAEDTILVQHRKFSGHTSRANASSAVKGQCRRKELCLDPIRPALISANDGPEPYLLYQPPGANAANARRLTHVYQQELGITGVRPDEAGLAFDLRCMFPVQSLDNLPDPSDDTNWRWNASDQLFLAIINGGFAPLLKLGVNTWTSTRISGQAYVNWTTSQVTYVIPPQEYSTCEPWPAISPVINAIGVVAAHVDRPLCMEILLGFDVIDNSVVARCRMSQVAIFIHFQCHGIEME